MIGWREFQSMDLDERVKVLYEQGSFVTSIRYYAHKVNLYLLNNYYVEVFYNPKIDRIEKVTLLDSNHSRMNFYYDQIKLPNQILSH
ncbi:MAG: hypothetical protein HC811_09850 [Flammeovirgaceae bacterium]|nr:hypothetical protein [Flammeovirgaceae bacterium]